MIEILKQGYHSVWAQCYYEIDGKEYLFISIESTAWNECFGSSGTGQYAFWTFNEGVLGDKDVYDPERFQGVWLYEGSIMDRYSRYPNITVSTKGLLESLLKLSTYIPYRTELS